MVTQGVIKSDAILKLGSSLKSNFQARIEGKEQLLKTIIPILGIECLEIPNSKGAFPIHKACVEC